MPNDAPSPEHRSNDGQRLSPERAARLMRLATYASVFVASILIAAKFTAWVSTGAVSLLSTLIDSLLDVGTSLLNLIAVRHALEPADKEHRFGHGKAEALSGLAQAAFICGSAAFLTIEAGERLLHPRAIDNTAIGYWVMVLAIVLTLALVGFQRHVVKQTGSVAITADSVHYRMDLLVNISVSVSLVLVGNLGWSWADPVFALAIAGYIVWGAWKIGSASYEMLMDRELADDERQTIVDIVLAHSKVLGLHDLRTRSAGNMVFIQMHLEMDGDMSLLDAHAISDSVEEKVIEAFPNAEVLIHEDPEGIEEERAVFH